MKNKKLDILAVFLILVLVLSITGCEQEAAPTDTNSGETPSKDASSPSKPTSDTEDKQDSSAVDISSLEIGSIVIDPSWEWEFRTGWNYVTQDDDITAPVTWIVVAKDHYDSGVTLLSEYLLGYFPFDTSVISTGHIAGQNHWGNSGTDTANEGIRPWLNSTGIHEGEGFYNAFSENFKSVVLPTTVPNREYENGENYTTSDNVFIPSSAELGDTVFEESYEIGKVYEYFINAEDDLRATKIKEDNFNRDYWLRNPITKGYRVVGEVYEYGFFVQTFADTEGVGVRPVVNISNGTKVSAEPNEDGIYVIKYN